MDENKFKTFHGVRVNKERLYEELVNHGVQTQALNELEQLENNLKDVQEAIDKETRDRERARKMGAVVGGLATGALGFRGGAGSAMSLGATGLSLGSKVGPLVESLSDLLTDDELDATLKKRKDAIKNKINKMKPQE